METLKSILGVLIVLFFFRYIYRDSWRALLGYRVVKTRVPVEVRK